MQYDYERAAAIINAFRDLVMEIKSIDNACQTEIKEADMAFCDIRHKCEIDYPIAAESLLFLMIIVSWLNGIKRRSNLMERV